MNPDLSKMPLCDQEWDALEPLGDGRRFCTRCRHPVTDFREMTKAEISMLHVMSDERVCGVYSPEQLAPVTAAEPRRCRSPLVALALGASLLAARADAQAVDRPATEQAQLPADGQTPQPPTEEPAPSHHADAQDTLVIRGTVRDRTTHAPIPQAIVLIEGTNRQALTDAAGGFILRTALGERRLRVRAGRIGYETRTLELVLRGHQTVVELNIETSQAVLAVGVMSSPRPAWQKAGFSIGRIDLSDR